MTDDARTALIARLKLHRYELVNGGANASELRADLLAAAELLDTLRTPAPDLRAWVQHSDNCPAWPQFTSHFQQATKVGACTCGLDAALASWLDNRAQVPPWWILVVDEHLRVGQP